MASFFALREVLKHGTIPFANVSRLHGALKRTGLNIAEILREVCILMVIKISSYKFLCN